MVSQLTGSHRVGVKQGNQTTRYVINPSSALSVLVRTQPTGRKTYYIHGPGLLYEMDESGNRLVYHYDIRGSTVAITDYEGKVCDRVEYNTYGQTTYRIGNTDTPFLFNGRYGVMTDANDLLHMQARFYNPQIRRFVNADPSAFTGGLNFYQFANGNPVIYVDPRGEAAMLVTGGIGAGIGALVTDLAAAFDNNPQTTVWGGVVGGATSGFLIGSGAGLFVAAGGAVASVSGVATLSVIGFGGEYAGGYAQQGVEYFQGARSGPNHGEILRNAGLSAVTTPVFGNIGRGVTDIAQAVGNRQITSTIQRSGPVIGRFEGAYDLPRASSRLLQSYGEDVARIARTWEGIGTGAGLAAGDAYGEVFEAFMQPKLPSSDSSGGQPEAGSLFGPTRSPGGK